MARPPPPPPGPDRRDSPLGAFDAPRIGEAQRRFWLIVDAMLAALVLVAVVGGWAYVQMRAALSDLRTAGLISLLEAESRTLQNWIDEKKRDADRWAATPEVRREAVALARLTPGGSPCESAPQRAVHARIVPFTALEEAAVFNLIARDGTIISSSHEGYCGRRISTAFAQELGPVFSGKTVFLRAWREHERMGSLPDRPLEDPLVWIEAPVRADDGSVVAALGFGRTAASRFTKLLRLTGRGTSRDAYAFDENAVMITEGRFSQGPLALPKLHSPLAAAALAREASEGVLLDPYPNYRGTKVIGAWRWLPAERIGVAVEVDSAEAFGPLEYLPIAFGVLFGLVLVSMTAAASASLWAVRIRAREAKRVGSYVIERPIGEGGMSDVYFARHSHLKRPAAVKVLKAHLATDEAVARFRREAQLCSQLSHPNTIEIYDYGTTRDGRWYYAMEFLRGLSIEEIVRRDGPLPLARVVHALRHACGSLEEAHLRGWVHRDVKPNNIMLCVVGGEFDFVKLLDFGLIKETRNPDTRDITQYSKVLGTPLYMAPERLRNPADADARSDIYALAAVAFFAITGRRAFQAETEHHIIYRVLNEKAPTFREAGAADVPAELQTLVARSLEKDRERRPATVAEVRWVLDDLARRHPWTQHQARAWWAAHAEALAAPE